ncbi:MAG: hypothetical protein NVS1B11_00870 [Terriglobales bacterium]
MYTLRGGAETEPQKLVAVVLNFTGPFWLSEVDANDAKLAGFRLESTIRSIGSVDLAGVLR